MHKEGIVEYNTENAHYIIAIDSRNVSDMKRVLSEYSQFGYSRIIETNNNQDTIIIYAKDK